MNVHLMYRESDFDLGASAPWNETELVKDLELETVLRAMARDDQFLYEVCRKALLCSLTDTASVRYRQEILSDCVENAEVIHQLYDLTSEAMEKRRMGAYFGTYSKHPSAILTGSVRLLKDFTDLLRRLRLIAERHRSAFDSQGLTSLFATLIGELDEVYLGRITELLQELRLGPGALLGASLGESNKGAGYVLQRPRRKGYWFRRLLVRRGLTYRVEHGDYGGARSLSEKADQAIDPVANATAQSADHIVEFFKALRTELAFYIGCMNLRCELLERHQPVCFPSPASVGRTEHSFTALYDPSLALTTSEEVVGSSATVGTSMLVFVTGANRGGKSTFLRSIGLAQLMMQAGMFVSAESFAADLCSGVFTHFRREEDATMKSGKFDEELGRMRAIVDRIGAGALMLFNESFSATNEREGSEIAAQIVSALIESGIRVFFVTHLYELARRFYEQSDEAVTFLRAARGEDGTRSFRIRESRPLPTSYGADLYDRVFGKDAPHGSMGGVAMEGALDLPARLGRETS